MTDILGIPAPEADIATQAGPPTTMEVVDLTPAPETSEPTGINAPTAEVNEPALPTTEQTVAQVAQTDDILDALVNSIAPAHLATNHIKAFIYGQNGCGKTVFAAQAPGCLIADCDKEGAISLLNHPSLRETKVLPVRSIFAVEQLVDRLRKGAPQLDWVQTLVIDPFDDLVYRGLSEQVRGNATVGIGTTTERNNQYLAEGYDYNVNTERFHQMMDEIKSLDRHVILTAHTVEKEDKGTGRTLIRSNLTPKLATIIGGAVSLVAYMNYDSNTGSRTLQTAPTPTIAAKTRLNLPPVMENPAFNSILDVFNKMKEEGANV